MKNHQTDVNVDREVAFLMSFRGFGRICGRRSLCCQDWGKAKEEGQRYQTSHSLQQEGSLWPVFIGLEHSNQRERTPGEEVTLWEDGA